jgi:2-dehydro-3-deoxyphosphogluconate aldolase/(4S)-4-hydroxy-2-oxoglutarate aldolase
MESNRESWTLGLLHGRVKMIQSVFDRVTRARIVPVVEIPAVDMAVPLAQALAEAGLDVVEVTLRTPEALDAIRAIHQALPEVIVGAGSLLNGEQVAQAADAGAAFGVSPGFSPHLSNAAASLGIALIPGVATASEVLGAIDHGHTYLKFFPAELLGGIGMLKAWSAPFVTAGVNFMPTGGVTIHNAVDYLALANVFAVGGTWIAPRSQIEAGNFDKISFSAREVVKVVTLRREHEIDVNKGRS